MRRQPLMAWTMTVILSLLLQALPVTPVRAEQQPGLLPTPAEIVAEPPAPESPVVVPDELLSPPLPALSIHASVGAAVVRVGTIITATLIITNLAPDPADDLVVTLPLPDGAVAIPDGKGMVDPRGWIWALGTLGGQQRVTVTATMRLTRMPTGEALLLLPEVVAHQLAEPVVFAGGALVDERVPPDPATIPGNGATLTPTAAAATPFTPGTESTIRSPGGRVEVRVPPDAATGPLQLTYRFPEEAEPELIAARVPLPPPLANGRHGFGTFHLDATDSAGKPVHTFAAPLTIVARYTPEQLRVLGMHPGQLTFFWFDPARTETRPDGRVQQGVWVPIPSQVDAETQTVTTTVDHFSAFQLGNGQSPSTTFIPSLKGWQVSTSRDRPPSPIRWMCRPGRVASSLP